MKKIGLKNILEAYYIFILTYFITGILMIKSIVPFNEWIEFIFLMIFPYSSLSYLVFGCLFYKHKTKLFYLIDCLLCISVALIIPEFDTFLKYIYDYNEYLYYLLGACFSFAPLIYSIKDKEKIKFFHIINIITRIVIICYIVLLIKNIEAAQLFLD